MDPRAGTLLVALTASSALMAGAQIAPGDLFWRSDHPDVIVVWTDADQLAQDARAAQPANWSVAWTDVKTGLAVAPRPPRQVVVDAADGQVKLLLDAPIEPWNSVEQLLDVVVTYYHPRGYSAQPLRRRAVPAAPQAPRASGYDASRGHADADIYFGGGFVASRTSRPAYTGEIKMNYRWLDWDASSLRAGFELTAASEANIDPDSLRASLSYRRALRSPGRAGKRPDWILMWDALGAEWGRQRDLVNLASAARLTWVPPAWGPAPRVFAAAEPFVGLDLGRSLSGRAGTRDRAVARPLLGTHVYLLALRPGGALDRVTLAAEYALRLPLTDEPLTRTRAGVARTTLTRRARPYLRMDLALQLKPGYGVTLKYEHGSLPPAFARVEHRVSLGATVQLARKLQ
jgi:hypothetical protein